MPTIKIPVSRPEALSRLTAELTSYGSLPEDWDGDGASAPFKKDVEAALQLVAAYPASLMLPKSCLSSAGEVSLYWETAELHADLEFFDGNISLFLGSKVSEASELLMDLVPEEMSTSWIEDKLRFFKA